MPPLAVEGLCRTYAVAGRSLTIRCSDADIAERAAKHVAGWHFSALPDGVPSDFVIELSRDAAPPRPERRPDFAVHNGHCYTEGGCWSLATSDSWMDVPPLEKRRIEVWVGPETARSAAAFARVFFYAVQAALRRCGLFELHAAAVVSPAREAGARPAGVLVIGPSGSGKTTLAMRLTAAGWSNVADDLVLVRDGPPEGEAFAFRRVFAATDRTLEACPTPRVEAATREPSALEPGKRRLDPEVLFPGRFAPSCTPRALAFPRITGEARSEALRLAPPDALKRLLRMCPWAAYDTAVARPHLDALARLARTCSSYELRAGTDLLEDARAAPRLFAPLAAAAL